MKKKSRNKQFLKKIVIYFQIAVHLLEKLIKTKIQNNSCQKINLCKIYGIDKLANVF